MKRNHFMQLFVIYLRYLIGFAFIFASIVKIQGLRFTTESGAENPIDTSWHFFETLYASGLYWRFLGWAQFITGALLVTQRLAKLGAVLFLPVIANVFVITISYDFHGTPVITGLMLLSTLFLLYWDKDSLKVLWNSTPSITAKRTLENDILWVHLGFIFIVVTIFSKLFLEREKILLGFLAIFILGIFGLFKGLRRRKMYMD